MRSILINMKTFGRAFTKVQNPPNKGPSERRALRNGLGHLAITIDAAASLSFPAISRRMNEPDTNCSNFPKRAQAVTDHQRR